MSLRRHNMLLALLCLASMLLAAMADKTAANYYIESLPGAPAEPKLEMYAGHIEITPQHHGNMFFWLYKNRHIANKKRLVIWLNGGPGCSSMDGALMELGPYRVNPDQTLRLNDGSWDEFANLLFVDNPVGTGFSYVDTDSYVHELDEMADQFVKFMENWFAVFPEHAHEDIYIAGESYAGSHIPYIAKAILDRNAATNNVNWNVKGLLIGNGWISGKHQYSAYGKFAKANGLIQEGTNDANQLAAAQARCDASLAAGGDMQVSDGICEEVLSTILQLTSTDGQCYNMYDIRLKDSSPSCGMNWPPDLVQITPYLRKSEVLRALHINEDKKTAWVECNGGVGGAFNPRRSGPSFDLLPGLLEKMPIILFSGDRDLICNHLGTEELINNLEWNGGKGMELSPGVWARRRDWTFEGEAAGVYQEARNLTYLRFFNSSHMVPFDYPRRTRDMLDRFMGVDIGSIGGKPTDSVIDGEKAPSTSVGGHPNSTAAQEDQQAKLQKATWAAYRRSAEAALLVLIIILGIWGFFFLRARRRRAGYKGLFTSDPDASLASGLGLDGYRSGRGKNARDGDIEAAAAFDEAELDDLSSPTGEDDHKFVVDDDEDDAKGSRRTS